MKLESKLINHLSMIQPNTRWLEFNGQKWQGTKALYDRGIKVCGYCGFMMPIEKEYCKCGERVFCDYVVVSGQPDKEPVRIKLLKPGKGKVKKKGVLVV